MGRKRLRQLALTVLAALSAFAQGEDNFQAEILCPCSVESLSQAAVHVKFDLRITAEASALGPLIVILEAEQVGRFLSLGERNLGDLPSRGDRYTADFVMGLHTPLGADAYALQISLRSAQGDLIYQAPLEGLLEFERGGGSAEFTKASAASVFYTQDPRVTASPTTLDVTFPEIINTSDDAFDDLSFRLIAAEGPDIFNTSFIVLAEANLEASLPSQGTLTNLRFETTFAPPPSRFNFYHLQLRHQGRTLSWKTVATQDGGPIKALSFLRTAPDLLTDEDGDGASDHAERALGTDPGNPQSTPPPSRPKVLFLYGQRVLDFYGDRSALANRVAHVVAVANEAMDLSDVPLRFEIAGLEAVFPSSSARNKFLLDAMADERDGFEGLGALQKARGADYVSYLDIHDDGDSCGIAFINGFLRNGNLADSNPFNVIDLDCRSLVLAHELGHNLGLGHSRTEGERGTYSWAVGHGEEGLFNTLMVSVGVFNAPELLRFSNPRTLCTALKRPCGIARTDPYAGADAAGALRAVRFQAAALTSSPPPQIALAGDELLTLTVGQKYQDPGFRAEDVPDGDLTAAVTIEGQVDPSKAGRYRLRYRVFDSDGNLGTAERVVSVQPSSSIQDQDADGTPDNEDAFPDDATEQLDQDGDGLGNNQDTDDDGDGFTDDEEREAGTDPLDAKSIPLLGRPPALLSVMESIANQRSLTLADALGTQVRLAGTITNGLVDLGTTVTLQVENLTKPGLTGKGLEILAITLIDGEGNRVASATGSALAALWEDGDAVLLPGERQGISVTLETNAKPAPLVWVLRLRYQGESAEETFRFPTALPGG